MTERKGLVTVKGNPLTLIGTELKVGDTLPNVTLAGNDLEPVELSKFKGKNLIIACVPSLDTPICDLETKKFNNEATSLGDNTLVLTVSMDLPFAQKRWCGTEGVERVKTLSDYKDASLGNAFGVLIKELRLLARSIFVVDKEGTVRYVQLVKELTSEPDYNAVLSAVRGLK